MLVATIIVCLLLNSKDQAHSAKDATAHQQQQTKPNGGTQREVVNPQHTDSTDRHGDSNQKQTENNSENTSKHFAASDWIGLAVLCVTSVYVFLQFYIWRGMVATLSLARVDLRPWVTIRDFGVSGEKTTLVVGEQKTFMILVKNTGKTPAFIDSAGTHTTFSATVPTTIPHFTPPASSPILSPDDEHYLEVIIEQRAQADWNSIAGGGLHLIAFVVIRYHDVDRHTHETTSAHELRRTGAGDFRWAALPNLGSMT